MLDQQRTLKTYTKSISQVIVCKTQLWGARQMLHRGKLKMLRYIHLKRPKTVHETLSLLCFIMIYGLKIMEVHFFLGRWHSFWFAFQWTLATSCWRTSGYQIPLWSDKDRWICWILCWFANKWKSGSENIQEILTGCAKQLVTLARLRW